MKFVTALIILFFFSSNFFCCTFKSEQKLKNNNKIIKAVIFSDLTLFEIATGKQLVDPDTLTLFSLNDIIILKKKKSHQILKDNYSNSDTVYLEIDSIVEVSDYFLYKKRDKYGIYFDTFRNSKKVVLVDSFFTFNTLQIKINANDLLEWKLVSKSENENLLSQQFVSKEINTTTGKKDSLKLTFKDEYKNIEYTISKSLDSLYQNKLVEISFTVDEYYDQINKIQIPKQVIYVKIEKKEIEVAEISEVSRLIKKY